MNNFTKFNQPKNLIMYLLPLDTTQFPMFQTTLEWTDFLEEFCTLMTLEMLPNLQENES